MKTFIQLCVVLCNKTRRASLFLLYFLNAVFLVHRESRWQPQLLLCELYALRRASLNWSYPTGSSARLSPAAAAVTLSCLANVRWISTLLSDRSSSTRYRSASYKWNISSQFSFSKTHKKTILQNPRFFNKSLQCLIIFVRDLTQLHFPGIWRSWLGLPPGGVLPNSDRSA